VLERQIVSTSDWHDPEDDKPLTEFPPKPRPKAKRKAAHFGDPCPAKDRMGHFTHWQTLKTIKVKDAGCSRFRIEIEYGKFMFPNSEKSLKLLEPSLLKVTERVFDVKFAQGCWWCL
jgi:hypothetical protein